MKVLILGAGFGGIEVARKLSKRDDVEITVLSDRDYFEYYPGLYHVAHGNKLFFSYVPLSYIFNKKIVFYKKTVSKIDSLQKSVVTTDGTYFGFDYLVIALGSEPNYFNTKGVNADTILSVKNYTYAEQLKKHIDVVIQKAIGISDATLHNMVVIGAGPTGVELASDLAQHIQEDSSKQNSNINFKVHLVDASPRVLKVFPEKASTRVHKRLEELGVIIHLNEKVLEKKDNVLVLGSGEIQTDTCIWSGGTKVVSVIDGIEGLTYTTPQKKIEVDQYMRSKGNENIFVLGDNAATQFSGLAQTAIADGYYVARSLENILDKKNLIPYVQKQNAYVVPVGAPWGVLVIKNKVFTGLIPFLGRYIIDTMYFMRILSFWKFINLPFKKFNPSTK